MINLIETIDDVKDPRVRRRLYAIADIYHKGNLQAAIDEYNKIEIEMDALERKTQQNSPMEVSLRFTKGQ